MKRSDVVSGIALICFGGLLGYRTLDGHD